MSNLETSRIRLGIDNDYLKDPKYLAPLCTDSSSEKNFDILTKRETIENLAKRICNNLGHPVTILDINWLEKNKDPEVESNIRIDPNYRIFFLA